MSVIAVFKDFNICIGDNRELHIYRYFRNIIQHIIYWIYKLNFIGHILVILSLNQGLIYTNFNTRTGILTSIQAQCFSGGPPFWIQMENVVNEAET